MDKKILNKAIKTYGIKPQLDMCIEEMSELTKEICKFKRGGDNRNEIIEELADVNIMLNQLTIMFNIDEQELDGVIDIKIERLKERLEQKDEK